jgi:hypothetical protein
VYGFIGTYDIESIMQYNFALRWYKADLPGKPNPCRRKDDVYDLSEMDKYVVAALYQPSLNQTAERIKFFASANQTGTPKFESAAAAAAAAAAAPQLAKVTAQATSVNSALQKFSRRVRAAEPIVIQVYPHKADEKIVMSAISNLGYPLTNKDGKPIRTVSPNTTAMLRDDPTNTLLYTRDVSDQDVRYVALALIEAGIEIKSIQPYVPHQRNNFAERKNLIQIGADVTNRNRDKLGVEDILDKPLPIFGVRR